MPLAQQLLAAARRVFARAGIRARRLTAVRSMSTVNVLRDAGQRGELGVDVGGTMAKLVLAEPIGTGSTHRCLPSAFGSSGAVHAELELSLRAQNQELVLRFVSGLTSDLEVAIYGLLGRHVDASFAEDSDGSAAAAQGIRVDADAATRAGDDAAEWNPVRRLHATGGGAHRLRKEVRAAFNIEFVPVGEFEALLEGLIVMHALRPAGEVYGMSDTGEARPLPWPEPLFPLLLVNIGSGVSILRLDGVDEATGKVEYERLGGTSCGGATFLGLARLIIPRATNFETALDLAKRGDAAAVDKLVKDVYGGKSCSELGLPPTLTAASFGKLVSASMHSEQRPRDEDIAAALLTLVAQAAATLAKAYAAPLGASAHQRIFFSGGFVVAENTPARAALARSLRALGGVAHFLHHADFLGALGALGRSICEAPQQLRSKWPTVDWLQGAPPSTG